jgi:hypothetical protein
MNAGRTLVRTAGVKVLTTIQHSAYAAITWVRYSEGGMLTGRSPIYAIVA